MRRQGRQLELPSPSSWGGRRDGAGRKPAPGRRRVAHCRRGAHDRRSPVHVTLRACETLPSLRRDDVFAATRTSFAKTSSERFRLLHYSVQRDHIHLLVEGDGASALRRGIQGLAIRVAKAINRALGRRARSGGIDTMPARSRRRARCGMRWSTCCRTGRSTSREYAGSIRGLLPPGSRDGER